LRNQRPIIRSDGRHVRDYFYVEDAARALTMAAECLAESRDLGGHAFNFSNETPMAVCDLVNDILRLMGSELEPVILNTASNEIHQQYLSAEKARKLLGWRPQFALEQGLQATIRWYQQFFGEVDFSSRP
jgi:CDP-glucose 4,6-dehydratase